MRKIIEDTIEFLEEICWEELPIFGVSEDFWTGKPQNQEEIKALQEKLQERITSLQAVLDAYDNAYKIQCTPDV